MSSISSMRESQEDGMIWNINTASGLTLNKSKELQSSSGDVSMTHTLYTQDYWAPVYYFNLFIANNQIEC